MKLFQKIMIALMNWSQHFVFIASRGCGKTFLIAIFACVRAILYPGTKIVIAAGTRDQAINVIEKIKTELKPRSPLLCAEIQSDSVSTAKAEVVFYNGSYIKVVTAGDSARGNRANILIVDEYRKVKKSVVDEILKKFLTNPRHPGYLDKPEYSHMQEPNKEYFLSSAYFKSHWCYAKALDFAKHSMDDTKKYFACGFPYQLPLEEGIYMREAIEDEMAEDGFSELKWNMEMGAEFFGDDDGSFFQFDDIAKTRTIQHVWLPNELAAKLGDAKFRIPAKQPGEKRIISADIALMASRRFNNDAASIVVNQLVPTRAMRYMNNIVFMQNYEGERTEDLALYIRKYYEEFNCDYIVLDARSVGIPVYDYLSKDMADPDTGEIYPALSCYNNEDYAVRCKTPNAPKVVWAVIGASALNADFAINLREAFKSGRIRLPVSEYDAEDILGGIKGYASKSPEEKMKMQLTYINTTLLINELINLNFDGTGRNIKLKEKSTARKDRYSSLSYNIYVASQFEPELAKPRSGASADSLFIYKAPAVGRGRW